MDQIDRLAHIEDEAVASPVSLEVLGPAAMSETIDLIPLQDEPEQPELVPLWLRRNEIAINLDLPLSFVKRETDKLRVTRPTLFKYGENPDDKNVIFCSSEILEFFPAPADWTTCSALVVETGLNDRAMRRVIDRFREQFGSEIRHAKSPKDHFPREYFSPRLADEIREAVGERRNSGPRHEKAKKIQEDFELFADEMKAGETLNAQEFEKLINVFGPESGFDVLYQYRPEFKSKVVMPMVKSFLAEYLGEFIITQGELDLDNLDASLPYLDNKDLQISLREVIKRHCLKNYHRSIRGNPNQDDFDIIAEYLDGIEKRTKDLDSIALKDVLKQVEDYYLSLFQIEIPSNIIGGLSEGRPFPDLNQRLNIKEVQLNRKMLIGDEPGMGKSASAILSKEYLGAKCAVIVSPSQVLDEEVWQNYLSDKIDADGQQLGYFKPGEVPRLLVVNHKSDLEGVKAQDYDYIVISESKINEEYTGLLLGINYDMLIVDEAHRFKNISDGVRSNHLIDLAKKIRGENKYLMLLTATPAPNKVVDIALALRLLYPKKCDQYSNPDLVNKIIHGDVLDIRSLLLPRMQIKRLADSIEMPPLHESDVMVQLTDHEKIIYEVLLDEWELEASEKLMFLRKVLLNPEILDATPGIPRAKIEAVGAELREAFRTKNKVLMFVNDYVTGVITGDKTIIPGLQIPADVKVGVIFGDVPRPERHKLQAEFQSGNEKMLLILSGQTVNVGVDLSAAEETIFYNEPWTDTEKRQELGRSWRPGRIGELIAKTYITEGSIEVGINRYIKDKYRAIEKLLYGIPLTDLECELVERSEQDDHESLTINPELGSYYFSSMDRMNKIFSRVKEIGEPKFERFLAKHGAEYAKTYLDLSNRSFQANASRLSGTVISTLDKIQPKNTPLKILDLGSGPEMLKRHISDDLADQVISLDINKEHFITSTDKGSVVAGANSRLPLADKSIDYANMSLVLHYTSWLPSKGDHERLRVLGELNRVLKNYGTAVITFPYSLDIRDEAMFKRAVKELGFQVIDNFSGPVTSGQHFKARVITLQKFQDTPVELTKPFIKISEDLKQGLRFLSKDVTVRDTRKIATDFDISEQQIIKTVFNFKDQLILEEEEDLLNHMRQLRSLYGRIEDIPSDEIISRGYSRIFNGKGYVLFKRLALGDGAVVFRNYS